MFQYKKIWIVVIALAPLLFIGCKKGGGGNASEANLQISINPDLGSTPAIALGSTYNFNLVIESAMPSQGVDVNVVYRRDSDNSSIFSQTLQTSTTPLNVTVSNIPANITGTVTVDVKSRTKADNTAAKSFKLVRK